MGKYGKESELIKQRRESKRGEKHKGKGVKRREETESRQEKRQQKYRETGERERKDDPELYCLLITLTI